MHFTKLTIFLIFSFLTPVSFSANAITQARVLEKDENRVVHDHATKKLHKNGFFKKWLKKRVQPKLKSKNKSKSIRSKASAGFIVGISSILLFALGLAFAAPALLLISLGLSIAGIIMNIRTLNIIGKSDYPAEHRRERSWAIVGLVLSSLVIAIPLTILALIYLLVDF